MTQEALKLALDALERFEGNKKLWPEAITAIKQALAQTEQEPVEKPYAYEYGRCNADGTYSVVIDKGDLVQTMRAVYNYVRPRNAHKDWPIKELFDRPPQRTEQNFCSRCGKRTTDLTVIHTCTPPQD